MPQRDTIGGLLKGEKCHNKIILVSYKRENNATT